MTMQQTEDPLYCATVDACRFRGDRAWCPADRIDYHDAHHALVEGFHGPGVRSLVAKVVRGIRRSKGRDAARRELRALRFIQGSIPLWGGADGVELVKS